MAENVSAQITTSPDLAIAQSKARKAIITSPEPVLQTAEAEEPEDTNE